jgi:hypothetical protein
MKEMQTDDRGQAFALEGIIAAVIVASALILGLQAVDLEPLTSGDDRTNEQLRTQVADALDVAAESGDSVAPTERPNALREAVTCVSLDEDGTGSRGPRHAVPNPAAVNPEGSTQLSAILDSTLEEEFNYRIVLEYPDENASSGVERSVLRDTELPSQPTVTVTRQIPLYESDKIRGNENCETISGGITLDQGEDFDINLYVDNQHLNSELYAVVQLKVIAW